jgi:hypothetical protein
MLGPMKSRIKAALVILSVLFVWFASRFEGIPEEPVGLGAGDNGSAATGLSCPIPEDVPCEAGVEDGTGGSWSGGYGVVPSEGDDD